MTRDILVGLDAGTSVIKSVAFSRDGRQVASCSVPNSYRAVEHGGSEQDIAQTWTDAAATLRGLQDYIPDLSERILALAVTGQGDGNWLIDEKGEPVQPAWLWLDARSADIVDEMKTSAKNQILYARTNTGLAACQMGPQLVHILRKQPEILKRAATAFHCKDWLYFKLTAERATDPTEGLFTFGNYRTRQYDLSVVETLGLEHYKHLLPPIVDGAVTNHWLTGQAAKDTGLPEGLPVILGYVDVICTALGAGLYDANGQAGVSIVGSTGMHMRFARDAANVAQNSDCTGYTMAFPVPDSFAQMQSNMAATLNIDWLVDLIRSGFGLFDEKREKRDVLLALDQVIAASAPGQILYHPYISEAGERGPFIDAAARASFVGLSTRHQIADLGRAIYEGLCFAARDCYMAMGGMPKEIRLTGGAARSAALKKIMASVLRAPVRTSSQEEAGAAGAAMIAAVNLKLYPSFDECVDEWVMPKLGASVLPDPTLADHYDRLFPTYVSSRKALAPSWRALREFASA